MPPDTQPSRDRERASGQGQEVKERKEGSHHKERIGNYIVGGEIGRGSFATVYKGYRSVCRVVDSQPLLSLEPSGSLSLG
jgi:hypothetical protein